jgi:NAD dependent epimerase/dehydratase family enzyme
VPAFVLRTVLGEMAEIVLTGQRAVPRKVEDAGYAFRYPKLDEALRAIVKQPED